jgi:hypothetical protein
MDGRSFDTLTRTLGTSGTRRGAMRFLAGALGAAVDRFGPVGETSAAPVSSTCRATGRRCDRDNECCAKLCKRGTCRCRREGVPCTSFETCCSGACDFLVDGGTCAPCRGQSCSADYPCCGGLACTGGFCGGCRDRGSSCSANSDCCFSDCVGGACLSAANGRCARDADCQACYYNNVFCDNACVNGTCQF